MTGSGGSSSVLKTFMPEVYESTLENLVEVEHAVLFATATSVCCVLKQAETKKLMSVPYVCEGAPMWCQ
jgi:hypothetical protein